MNPNNTEIKKALVTLAIEQVLLDINNAVLETVINKLYQRYQCYLPDCYENPEYLNHVLKEVFGSAYKNIIEAIRKNLEEFSYQKPIAEFLIKISK